MRVRALINSCLLATAGLFALGGPEGGTGGAAVPPGGLRLTYFGHAMFMIETADGTRIITDPYSEKTGYKFPTVDAEIVTVSHHHYDHDNAGAVGGSPKVVETQGSTTILGINIEGIPSYHDEVKGEKRGNNIIFKFAIERLTVVHMGDYGEPALTEDQRNALKGVDVLLLPVGGNYTIDAGQAAEIVRKVRPRVVVPMHYKTEDTGIKINDVELFLQRMPVVKRKGSNVLLPEAELPKETEVWVMGYIQ